MCNITQMESIILEYLSKTYSLDVNTNQVLDKGDKIYGVDLLSELELLFGVPTEVATAIVEIWIEDTEPNFNIEDFWFDKPLNVLHHVVLPVAQRIAARTVGMDIVPVQPMSAPNNLLTYLDFTYSGVSNNGRIYDEEIFTINGIPPQYFGELDHPTGNTYHNIFSGTTGV